jgi:hypothetical protein
VIVKKTPPCLGNIVGMSEGSELVPFAIESWDDVMMGDDVTPRVGFEPDGFRGRGVTEGFLDGLDWVGRLVGFGVEGRGVVGRFEGLETDASAPLKDLFRIAKLLVVIGASNSRGLVSVFERGTMIAATTAGGRER